MRLLANLLKKKRGAAAIEFALVAPLFFLLILGIMEFGITTALGSTMQQSLRAAARHCMVKQVVTGSPAAKPCDEAEFRRVLQYYMQGFYKPEKINIYVEAVPYFLQSGVPCCTQHPRIAQLWTSPDAFFVAKPYPTEAQQGNGAIMIYGMDYQWGGVTNLMSVLIPQKMIAVTITRNEF